MGILAKIQQLQQFIARRSHHDSARRRRPLPGSQKPRLEQLEARLLLHANLVLSLGQIDVLPLFQPLMATAPAN